MTDVTRERTRPVLLALFAAYIVVLVWLVLWKLHAPFIADGTGTVKLVPFVRTADAGSSAPREVWGNVAVFVPFGVYLGLLGRRWWTSLTVIALTSAALEATQFILGVGVTDVTDVIANTAGGLAGLILVGAVGRRRAARRVLAVLCVVGTAFALVALAVFLAAPMRPMAPL